MATKSKVIVKNATKEKADFVETHYEEIIACAPGISKIGDFLVKRLKNTFIIL